MAARLEPTSAFASLCSGLHQDAFVGISTIEELAANCLDFVRDDEREGWRRSWNICSPAGPPRRSRG